LAVRLAQTRRAYSNNDGNVVGRRHKKKRWRNRTRLRARKIVIIGDMNSGKSELVSSYCSDQFSEIYQPTILRCLSSDAKIRGGQTVDITIIDTPGRLDYFPIRRCAYNDADVILMCFALDQPESLQHITDHWINEVDDNTPSSVPLVLVGNRMDIRDELFANYCQCSLCNRFGVYGCWTLVSGAMDNGAKDGQGAKDNDSSVIVTSERGQLVAREIGAKAYIECSAKYRTNIRDVFERSADISLKRRRKRKQYDTCSASGCTIL
jgi:Ras family protein A